MKKTYLMIGKHKIDITNDFEKTVTTYSVECDDLAEGISNLMNPNLRKATTRKVTLLDLLKTMEVKEVDKEEDSYCSTKVFVMIDESERDAQLLLNDKLYRRP